MSWRAGQCCIMTPTVSGIATARFTAASADTYQLDVEFENRVMNGAGTNVYVLVDSGIVHSDTVSGFESGSANYSNYTDSNISLAAGGTIDFCISGAGLHQVGIDATIIAGSELCGGEGFVYMAADVDQNCEVNLDDLIKIATNWLKCTNADDPLCP